VVSGGFTKFVLWEVQGSNPVDSQYNFTYKHNDQRMSDTWRPRVGPRVLILFAQNEHVSTPYSPKNRPTKICHITVLPRHRMVQPCHVTVRTVRTGTVSIPKFCLFGLADRSRYLLHTDSVCESKYTAGIRKTRRTQWHYFRCIPSTLKIEQNLIP
jgi:hypothetical protein